MGRPNLSLPSPPATEYFQLPISGRLLRFDLGYSALPDRQCAENCPISSLPVPSLAYVSLELRPRLSMPSSWWYMYFRNLTSDLSSVHWRPEA